MPDGAFYSSDTKKRIKESLLRLLASSPKGKVTIKEIALEAGLNRGTFYIHYKDIDALLSEIEEEALAEIRSILNKWALNDKTSHQSVISSISRHLEANRDILKNFLIYDSDILPGKVRELVRYGYQILIKKNNLKMNESEIEITISAIYGILNDWAVNESTYDIKEFKNYLLKQIDRLLEMK